MHARCVGTESPLAEEPAGSRGPGSTVVRRAALATLAVATLALASRVDAFLYWADVGNNTIGRANIDGSAPNQSFINTGLNAPAGVAVDGAHVYWTNNGTIGRANVDGSGVNQRFMDLNVTFAAMPFGVALDCGG